jgi:hypothetical protein
LPAVTVTLPPPDTESPTFTEILLLPDEELPVDRVISPALLAVDDPELITKSPLPFALFAVATLTPPLDFAFDAPLTIETEPPELDVENPLVIDIEPSPVALLPADNITSPAVPDVELPVDMVTDPDEPDTEAPECSRTAPLLTAPVAAAVNIFTDPDALAAFVETPLVMVILPPALAVDDPPVKLTPPPWPLALAPTERVISPAVFVVDALVAIDTDPVFPAADEPVTKPISPESPFDVCDAVDRLIVPL